MGAGLAFTPLRLSQSLVPKAPLATRSLASAILASSSSSSRLTLSCTTSLTQQPQSRSCEFRKYRPCLVQHVCRASFHSFSDEEFLNRAEELTLRMGNNFTSISGDDFCLEVEDTNSSESEYGINMLASIERKASCMDLPLSIRMLKRKLQWQEGFREAGESSYCSIKTAFSSMVSIVREIQSFTLQMREIPPYEDLQSQLVRAQEDLHASFVWLFQTVFSQTPTLMLHLMILLANFSVHSMGCTPAIAASLPSLETVSKVEIQDRKHDRFLPPPTTTFSTSSSTSGAQSTSIGGGDENFLPGVSGADGEGQFGQSVFWEAIFPNGSLTSSSLGSRMEEEVDLWNSIVEEASEMQAAIRDESLDHETVKNFVSPVIVKAEADDNHPEYSRTEVLYQIGLSQDPNNPLLLANYAQFLYLVTHDYDGYQFISLHLILL